MRRQRQVWLILIADERVDVQVKVWNPLRTCVIPERLCGGDSLWLVLYQAYTSLLKRIHLYPYFYQKSSPAKKMSLKRRSLFIEASASTTSVDCELSSVASHCFLLTAAVNTTWARGRMTKNIVGKISFQNDQHCNYNAAFSKTLKQYGLPNVPCTCKQSIDAKLSTSRTLLSNTSNFQGVWPI